MSVTRRKQSEAGFALVVLAALFVAFSVVAAVLIEKATATRQINAQEEMRAKLSRISNAVIQYYIFNATSANHYPCPAPITPLSTDAGFGIVAANCYTAQAIPAGLTGLPGNVAGDAYIRGMVPVVSLAPYGLTLDDAFDAWGNRIMYIVDRKLAVGGAGGTGTGTATLPEWRSATTMLSPDFLVISYGRDRLGGFPRDISSATPAIACAATAGQVRDDNCNGNIAFTMGPANTGEGVGAGAYFDDIVSAYTH